MSASRFLYDLSYYITRVIRKNIILSVALKASQRTSCDVAVLEVSEDEGGAGDVADFAPRPGDAGRGASEVPPSPSGRRAGLPGRNGWDRLVGDVPGVQVAVDSQEWVIHPHRHTRRLERAL